MKELLKSHTYYYLTFTFVMSVCLFFILLSASQAQEIAGLVVLTAFLYAFWGITHHILHHDIALKIVLEYVLISILGVALVLLIGT